MALKFQIQHAQGPQPWFWRIVEGEDVLARSETMYNRSDALAAARKMKYQTSEYEFTVISTTDREYPYSWHAVAKNTKIVVSSTNLFRYYQGAYDAMEHVRRWAPSAEIQE